jgi:hypothetical protein
MQHGQYHDLLLLLQVRSARMVLDDQATAALLAMHVTMLYYRELSLSAR